MLVKPRLPGVPAWLTLSYTLLVGTLAPPFVWQYGLTNFLWFSNVALLGTLVAIWSGSRLLLSMMAVAALVPETAWNVIFWTRLLFGWEVAGLLDYMFDARIPLWARLLSLYHVPLPFLLLWLVWQHGYDPRALPWQIGLAWIVLPVSFLVSTPIENINLVYGLRDEHGQPTLAPPIPLLLLMAGLPLVVYWPTHAALKRYFARRGGASVT